MFITIFEKYLKLYHTALQIGKKNLEITLKLLTCTLRCEHVDGSLKRAYCIWHEILQFRFPIAYYYFSHKNMQQSPFSLGGPIHFATKKAAFTAVAFPWISSVARWGGGKRTKFLQMIENAKYLSAVRLSS